MKSIRYKIVAMTGIIAFLVATVMAIFGIVRMENLVHSSNIKYVKTLGREIALDVDAYMNRHIGYLEGHQRALSLSEDFSKSGMTSYVSQMAKGREDVLYIYFNTPRDSGYLVSSDGWVVENDYSWENREWFEKTLATEGVYIDEPARDSVTDKLVILLRSKIIAANNDLKGYLNMAIDFEDLSAQLSSYDIPKSSRVMILDKKGNIMATNEAANLKKSDAETPNITDYTKNFQLDASSFKLNDKTYFAVPLNSAEWTLFIGVTNTYLDSGVLESILGFLVLYFFAGMGTIIYTRHFSREITKPIFALATLAKEIGQGNYHAPVDHQLAVQTDEMGMLAQAFSDMQGGILSRTQELQALYEQMTAAEETLRENYDELELYKDEVERFAYYDGLTGLPNRTKLLSDLKMLWELGGLPGRVLIMLSYSELNHYTTTLGQHGTENIDKSLATIMTQTFSQFKNAFSDQGDMAVYRVNPGRFLLIASMDGGSRPAPPMSVLSTAVESRVNELAKGLKNLQLSDSYLVRISLIAGAYQIPDEIPAYSDEDLIRQLQFVEAALLRDSPFAWFDGEMLEQRAYEKRLEDELVHAVENNELFVVYQKKYDVQMGVIGAEALVRWNHPLLGAISPGVFIPIAEKAGLIDLIDRFVAKNVLNFLSERINRGDAVVPIAINLSVFELIDPLVVKKLSEMCQVANVPPSSIVVEITETAFANHVEIVSRNVKQLKAAGFMVHLDDFGTGYSSLSYLSAFELDAIKIDISFTRFIETDDKLKSIVQAIMDLSKAIGAKVIAEGVENQNQMAILDAMGCDYYQGFYLSRPSIEI